MKDSGTGRLVYWVRDGKNTLRSLRLTVCSTGDMQLIRTEGVSEVRRIRLRRLLDEAREQGVRLSYKDLSLILLTSRATLKRDIREMRKQTGALDACA